MHTHCPNCEKEVVQAKNKDGPMFCPHCFHLFELPEAQKMPPWIFGVLVILTANLQIMSR